MNVADVDNAGMYDTGVLVAYKMYATYVFVDYLCIASVRYVATNIRLADVYIIVDALLTCTLPLTCAQRK